MATKKIKNRLTLTEIKSQATQLSKTKKVLLAGKYHEEIDIKFKLSKIKLLIVEYLKLLRQQEEITSDSFKDSTAIFNILIVKYFSTVDIQDVANIDDLISVSNTLFDIGILDDLFDYGENSFLKDQIEILTKEVDKTTTKIEDKFTEIVKESAELDALRVKMESELDGVQESE